MSHTDGPTDSVKPDKLDQEARASAFLEALKEVNAPIVKALWSADVALLEEDSTVLAGAMVELIRTYIKEQRGSWLEDVSGIGMEGSLAQATQIPQFFFTEISVGQHGVVRLPRNEQRLAMFSFREEALASVQEEIARALQEQLSEALDQAPREVLLAAAHDALGWKRHRGVIEFSPTGRLDWVVHGWAWHGGGLSLERMVEAEDRTDLCRAFKKSRRRIGESKQSSDNTGATSLAQRARAVAKTLEVETVERTCQRIVGCFLEDVERYWIPAQMYCGKHPEIIAKLGATAPTSVGFQTILEAADDGDYPDELGERLDKVPVPKGGRSTGRAI